MQVEVFQDLLFIAIAELDTFKTDISIQLVNQDVVGLSQRCFSINQGKDAFRRR